MVTKIGIYRDKRNRDRPWVCRWYTTIDPDTGKRKRFCKSFEFKRDAERFRAEMLIEFEQNGRPKANPEKQTLDMFLDNWLRRRKSDLKPASYELYQETAERLYDYFGKDCFLRDITPERAEDFIVSLRNRASGREGNKLSDWTRRRIKTQCKCIFRAAVKWGYLAVNPFSDMRLKRLSVARWYRLKPEEYHGLIETTPSLREKVAYSLFYTAGLRLHEAYNLTWDCIDFQKNILLVVNREPTADIPPFSIKDCEARRIPLPSHTVDLLVQWQSEAPEGVPFVLLTEERFERVKEKWHDVRKKGLPWKNRYIINNVLRNFKSHVKRAGIKPVGKFNIHTLRKCCGQNWADHLPMNVVKELMGHSNIQTTQEFYTTVDRDHEKKAAQVIEALLEKAQESKQDDMPDTQTDVSLTYQAENSSIDIEK